LRRERSISDRCRLGSTIPTTRDLVLEVENVLERAVVFLGPEMRTALGFEELRRDADAVAGPPHSALDYIAHAELAPDLTDVDRLALVGESSNCGRSRTASGSARGR
jgi:hypothetical protein